MGEETNVASTTHRGHQAIVTATILGILVAAAAIGLAARAGSGGNTEIATESPLISEVRTPEATAPPTSSDPGQPAPRIPTPTTRAPIETPPGNPTGWAELAAPPIEPGRLAWSRVRATVDGSTQLTAAVYRPTADETTVAIAHFDLATRAWSEPRSAVVPGSSIWIEVAGGLLLANGDTGATVRLDFDTLSVDTVNPVPATTIDIWVPAVTIDNLTIIGHRSAVWNDDERSWKAMAPPPQVGGSHPPTAIAVDREVLYAGFAIDQTPIYNVDTNSWRTMSAPKGPYRGSEGAAVVAPGGRVLLVDESNDMAAWLNPGTDSWILTEIPPHTRQGGFCPPRLESSDNLVVLHRCREAHVLIENFWHPLPEFDPSQPGDFLLVEESIFYFESESADMNGNPWVNRLVEIGPQAQTTGS